MSRLALAPENVRKTPPDSRADAELKASIAALGLLENLVVRTATPGEDGAECYAVVAGGRRLKALQALVEDNVLDADHPVPCLVRAVDGEVSLAENVVRIAMHCQTAFNTDPRSACKIDPPEWHGRGCPGSQ